MRRKQEQKIADDLKKKMVFITGPRQVGKTWLARKIMASYARPVYLNYDHIEDRAIMRSERWPSSADLIVFDEIHKMRGWKNYLKGVFDTKDPSLHMLITGSARLDTFRQSGDSLAGRFFTHHLLPFSLAELAGTEHAKSMDRLIARGGFPEPFLAENDTEAARWRVDYVDSLVREDVLDFERIHDARAIRTIFELLRRKVGSPVSYSSLARDADISPATAKKYVEILEALYVVFRVVPHSGKIASAIRKEPKAYFFDTGLVIGGEGARFENFIALSLHKHAMGRNDFLGERTNVRYARLKDGRETDFVLVNEHEPTLAVEAKVRDGGISKPLAFFAERFGVHGVQVVKDLKHEQSIGAVDIVRADSYLQGLFL